MESAYRNGFQTQEQFDVTLEDVRSVLNDYPGTRGPWADELDTHFGLSLLEVYALAHALSK